MGVPVRTRKTLLRGGVYLPPGTVFEYPTQADADYAIGRGLVTPYLDQPIKDTPAAEMTASGELKELPPEGAPEGDKLPDSFTDETPASAPSVPAKGKGNGKKG